MAWIESHDTLKDHPKTRRLRRFLGINVPQAIGHLHMIWWWALEYAEDGNLSSFDAHDVADAAEWDGDAEQFLSALINAGFVDKCDDDGLCLHDWYDYAGPLLKTREQNRERQRRHRERQRNAAANDDEPSRNGNVTRDKRVTNAPNQDLNHNQDQDHKDLKDIVVSASLDDDVANPGPPRPRHAEPEPPVADIIGRLNDKTGKSYRATSEATKRHVSARWREGYRLEDFQSVIDKKTAAWLGTDMEQYLRPQTLFGTKFESYLNEPWPGTVRPRDAPHLRAVSGESAVTRRLRELGVTLRD